MVFARWLVLPFCGGMLFAAIAALAQAPPHPDRIAMRFEVYGFAGLHLGTAHTDIEEAGEHYAIISDLQSRGVAELIIRLTNHSEVRGRLTPDSALPEAFRSDTERNGVAHHDRVEYYSDGRIDGAALPPPMAPIPPDQIRGTVDNLTAYFIVERRLGRGGACNFVVPVYEGRRRYDLRYTDRGEQTLEPAGGQYFTGATHVCYMKRTEIAGFAGDPERSEGAREGTIWYGRVLPGDLLIPVRMQLETELGGVIGYLAELHGRGVNLKLME